MSEHELYHYGVLGMKWGVRKAQKKGQTYTYKSHGQKKYERKLNSQTKRGASAKQIAKTQDKLNMYKTRDANRQDYATKTSVGKLAAKELLFGPFGTGNYNRMRAAGKGRLESAFVSNWVASTVGLPLTILYTRSVEKGAANTENRMRSRI